ncbi:cell wall metabolism sensor histidine kinase WalK [Radiobacillus sp. PE A8.2]|uniref:cell wall metabolism sensor histidine kinase WalK n=1 Tax=Radiobacillus sp. PE A8.2 TaxID=3380349 RepID=UPI00388E03A4
MKKVGFFQSITLKFIVILILLLLLAIQVIGYYFVQELEESLVENFNTSLEDRLEDLTYYLNDTFKKERSEEDPTLEDEVEKILDLYDSDLYTELQVIDKQSRIIGANNDDSQLGRRVIEDIDVTRAITFGYEPKPKTYLDRYTQKRMLVRIIPLYNEDEVVGVVRVKASMEEIYTQVKSITKIFLNGTLLAIAVSVIVGILVARTITKPITEMRKQAKIMSTGDFSQKVNVYGYDEIGQLATTFNEMNDKIKQAHLTTEGERRKLSSVLSNMSDGVIATDETGAITLMNKPATNLIGKSFEEIKGKQLIEVLQIDNKVVDLIEIQETGSVIIDFSDEEQFFLVKANFSIVQDENEMITGFITVISDVTEQEQVEKERREFVSNVSHELRTPLTTMRSYLEALTDGAWKDEEIAPRFMEVTQNETERMIRLVNDLLQLSKMENKDHMLYKERVNMVPYLHHLIDRFEINKTEHISFVRQLPNENVFIRLDKDKITQVVDNILSNAIKYSPEGGKISIKVIKDKHKLVVSISDEGMGIAREKLDKIFDRFYRADKARSRNLGGTGLGLAIAKEIVDAHHGQIWADSKEGKGTTIFFTLPLMNKKRRDKA